LIAVIASLVVLLYVLLPGALFRVITSLNFPVKLQKTKAQEITFAAFSCLVPFCLAVALVWTVAKWPFPTQEDYAHRRLAYRTVFTSLASDKQMDNAIHDGVFWTSANSVLRRQIRFLLWYYLLVGVEAIYFSWLATQYRSTGMNRWRDRIGSVVFRPSISEWAVLLTNFGSPKAKALIELDVLSTEGVLYQGRLRDYFFNTEGELAGVLLSAAARYDKAQYSAHQQVDLEATVESWPHKPTHKFTRDRATYWRLIPGADLFYIPREKISNINVRHMTPDIPKATEERLLSRKIKGYAIAEQPLPTNIKTGNIKATGET
jgi:hypothetical protein